MMGGKGQRAGYGVRNEMSRLQVQLANVDSQIVPGRHSADVNRYERTPEHCKPPAPAWEGNGEETPTENVPICVWTPGSILMLGDAPLVLK